MRHSPWWRKAAATLAAAALSIAGIAVTAPAYAADGPARTTTVSVTSASEADGLTLHVSGTGYTDLPPTSEGGPAQGVYVALRDVTVADADVQAGAVLSKYVPVIVAGAWSVDLVATSDKLDKDATYEVVVWVAHGFVTDATKLDTKPVVLSPGEREALFPTPKPEPVTTVSVTGATAKDGLTLHVTGTGYSDLPKASTGKDSAGVYVALRDVTTTDEQINADQGLAPAVAYIWSGLIKDGAWATDLTAPTAKLKKGASYEVIVWVAHGTITDDTLLDTRKVTLTAGQLSALFPSTGPGTDPGTDPGTTPGTEPGGDGAEGPRATLGSSTVAQGRTLVVTATGFVPGEKVSATVHSDPVSLGAKTADANGAVTFRWTIPAGFAAGAHTVVLTAASGTVTMPFRVAAAAALAPTPQVQCTTETVPATAGTPHLSWGVKSSFASYVTGGIANGSIATSNGAARVGGSFTWGSGSGSLASSGQGTVSFPGSVRFTGHDGVLDTTLSNPQVRVTGADTGVLLLTVNSKTMEGSTVSGAGIAFANLRFSSVSSTGGTASVTLTAEGARAFAGFYSAGESMDALTVSFSGARAATTQRVCYDADGNRVNADGTPYTGPALAGAGYGVNTGGEPVAEAGAGQWGWIPLVAGLLMLTLVVRRGTAARR